MLFLALIKYPDQTEWFFNTYKLRFNATNYCQVTSSGKTLQTDIFDRLVLGSQSMKLAETTQSDDIE